MAARVKGDAFKGRAKYPWSEWTDGSQWRVYKGDDYHISTYNMQISLHGRAKAEGKVVRSESFTRTIDVHGAARKREGLIFQFSDKETQ